MMLNYLEVFCQLKKIGKVKYVLLSLLFFACSTSSLQVELTTAIPLWLDLPTRFRSDSVATDEKSVHPFFDHLPFADLNKERINVIVETPQDSPVKYKLDLLSGNFYAKRKYCPQDDVWKSYRGTINRPPFTTALIPRLLDIQGDPQQVFIFGNAKFYQANFQKKGRALAKKSVRVKVIGSQILQFCDLFPCTKKQWVGRMVLFAVDLNDKKFSKIASLDELKKEVDWAEVKAFIENGQGRSFDGMKKISGKPAYRLINGGSARKSLGFAFRRGHYFKFKEMKNLQKTCLSLYDHIWDRVKYLQRPTAIKEDQSGTSKYLTVYSLSKRKSILNGNVLYSLDAKYLKQRRKMVGMTFVSFLKSFSKNFGNSFYLCSKYVPYSSIADNYKRAVFMSYFTAFFRLNKIGHNFNCSSGYWNPQKRYYLYKSEHKTILEQLQFCTTERLNRIFRSMVSYIGALHKTDHRFFYYIDYDNSTYGTHQKLYSWVFDQGKRFLCQDSGEMISLRDNLIETFPTDFTWQDFNDHQPKSYIK